MYTGQPIKLSYKILEFIAQHKYLSKTLAIYTFPNYSQSHIEKTLKSLFDNKLLLRKMIEREPIRLGREYVYYLSKKGAQKVLFTSDQFSGVEDLNVGSGNVNFIYHDLCVAWVAAMWKRQSEEYKDTLFDKLTIETRRNFLDCGKVVPDLKIMTAKNGKTLKYYIEVDNFTIQTKEWRKRCYNYRGVMEHNTYFLIVLTKFNSSRLQNLANIACEQISEKNIFATNIKDIFHCTYIANIWNKQHDDNLNFLPLLLDSSQ